MSALQLSIGLCFCSDASNVTSFNRLVLDGSCDIGLANTGRPTVIFSFNCNDRRLNGVVNSAAPGRSGRSHDDQRLAGRASDNNQR